MVNLAVKPEHRAKLLELRKAVHDWMLEIRDVGLLPECDFLARAKAMGDAPYNVGHSSSLPLERILDTADKASMREAKDTPELVKRLTDADAAVRFWAVLGLQMRGSEVAKANAAALRQMLKDPMPAPRLAAAETIARFGSDADAKLGIEVCLSDADAVKSGSATTILALNALTAFGVKAKPFFDRIKALVVKDPKSPQRLQEYPARLYETLMRDLA